jgi:hypothetical protein
MRAHEGEVPGMPNAVGAVLLLWESFLKVSTPLKVILYPRGYTPDRSSLDVWAKSRKLFRTDTGAVGVEPPDLKPGDIISALLGGKPLFVSRRVKQQDIGLVEDDTNTSLHAEEVLQVVRDAYMLNLMHGEAFQLKSMEFLRYFKLI